MKESDQIIKLFRGLDLVKRAERNVQFCGDYLRVTVRGRYLQIQCNARMGIVVDLRQKIDDTSAVMEEMTIDIDAITERFRTDFGEARIPVSGRFEDVICEIESSVEYGKTVITKIKVLELLAEIEGTDQTKTVFLPANDLCTPGQAVLARSIYSYLMHHMDRRVTIGSMAEIFDVSQSQIKESFKLYFGNPVFRFIRDEKMQIAARSLRNTDRPIETIAKECGYESPSKFTRAFKNVFAMGPRDYRNGSAY